MKKHITMIITAMMAAAVLAGCGTSKEAATTAASSGTAAAAEAGARAEAEARAETETKAETKTGAGAQTGADAKAEAAMGQETEILVAAAASLKNAYEEELIPMFQDKYPGVTVKGTYDSSGKLQTQIEEGLEADVFMSAANLLENKIVLIVPSDSDSGFTRFEDIEKAESIALGDPASVPVGQYSEEALTSLGIWDKIQDKVSFGTNVTEVLNQVAAASADAGIVYATDAASMADQVKVVAEAPEGSLAKKVIYPVAVVKDTANAEAAGNFVEFLKTDEAMKVFESYGFTKGE